MKERIESFIGNCLGAAFILIMIVNLAMGGYLPGIGLFAILCGIYCMLKPPKPPETPGY